MLGYEILKWESDTPSPDVFHPLDSRRRRGEGAAAAQALSVADRATTGSTSDAFLGLSRLRGVQCRSAHAEAFIVEKTVLRFGQGGTA